MSVSLQLLSVKRQASSILIALLAASSPACDRKQAAPQDLESGKAPTGTIQTASDRVDRVKSDEAPDVTNAGGTTSGGGGATSAPGMAGSGASGGAPGAGR
jgi:hypothetical protein